MVDLQDCCKSQTNVYLQKSVPIEPKNDQILPKSCETFGEIVGSAGCRATFPAPRSKPRLRACVTRSFSSSGTRSPPAARKESFFFCATRLRYNLEKEKGKIVRPQGQGPFWYLLRRGKRFGFPADVAKVRRINLPRRSTFLEGLSKTVSLFRIPSSPRREKQKRKFSTILAFRRSFSLDEGDAPFGSFLPLCLLVLFPDHTSPALPRKTTVKNYFQDSRLPLKFGWTLARSKSWQSR